MTLEQLAERVEQARGPDRALADEVLLACGWRLNHSAEEIAAWRTDPGTCEGEDGADHPVSFEDRMTWACWYKPGNRPFRDSWIDGHYRPDPLSSLDAAVSLVPEGLGFDLQRYWIGSRTEPAWMCEIASGGVPSNPRRVFASEDAWTAPLAITAAVLRARATPADNRAREGE